MANDPSSSSPIPSTLINRSKQQQLRSMFAIESPGIIENEQNFFKCCGGLEQIELTFKNPRERLKFFFRPDDPNSIPLFSERNSLSVDLAIKVIRYKRKKYKRKRRKKNVNDNDDDNSKFDYKFEPYGFIDTIFHFANTICDMQLLPLECKSDTPNRICNDLMKSNFILDCDIETSLKNDQATTLLKQYFYSRFTQPKNLFAMMKKEEMLQLQQRQSSSSSYNDHNESIRRFRKSRRANLIIIKWDGKTPQKISDKQINERLQSLSYILTTYSNKNETEKFDIKEEILKKLQERPIWSRSALLCELKCKPLLIRFLLPVYCYVFENGPFRNLFIPYGYDPRKDPKSKIYQNIEVRPFALINAPKTNPNSIANKFIPQSQPLISLVQTPSPSLIPSTSKSNQHLDKIKQEEEEEETSNDAAVNSNDNNKKDNYNDDIKYSYKFRPGCKSNFNSTSYQLCDVEIDEVQKIIHENDDKELICTEKYGWLKKDTVKKIRSIMNNELNKMLEKNPELIEQLRQQLNQKRLFGYIDNNNKNNNNNNTNSNNNSNNNCDSRQQNQHEYVNDYEEDIEINEIYENFKIIDQSSGEIVEQMLGTH